MQITPNNTTLVTVVEKSTNFAINPTFGNAYFRALSNLEVSIDNTQLLTPGAQWLFKAINCTITFKATASTIYINGQDTTDWQSTGNFGNAVLTFVKIDGSQYVFDLSGNVEQVAAP